MFLAFLCKEVGAARYAVYFLEQHAIMHGSAFAPDGLRGFKRKHTLLRLFHSRIEIQFIATQTWFLTDLFFFRAPRTPMSWIK